MGYEEKRKHVRFPGAPKSIAEIDFFNDKIADFHPEVVALIYEESSHGCGLILVNSELIRRDLKCIVKVGKLAPLKGQIAWTRVLDPAVMMAGIRYELPELEKPTK